MAFSFRRFFCALMLLLGHQPGGAWAQEPPASLGSESGSTEPASTQQAEDKIPTTETALPLQEISLGAWQDQDWLLSKSSQAIVEMHGAFRFRLYWLQNLDFGNGTTTEPVVQTESKGRYPALTSTPGKAGNNADYRGATMRLRLEPLIRISDRISIHTTLDLLENMQLGSTPDTLDRAPGIFPGGLLARTQWVPRRGINSVTDSLAIKRVWLRATALNDQVDIRLGRLPDHFGLGALFNDGDKPDADYGTIADRVALSIKFFEHIGTLMVDWVHSGPSIQPFGRMDPAPLDASPMDDAVGFGFRLLRQHHPEAIVEATSRADWRSNYGLHLGWRQQPREFSTSLYDTNQQWQQAVAQPILERTGATFERRDGNFYQLALFGQFFWGTSSFGIEGATQYGSYLRSPASPGVGGSQINIWGVLLASKLQHQFTGNIKGLHLALHSGLSSADAASGFGVLDKYDGQQGSTKGTLNNMPFSPDYHVDLLLYRRLIGTISESWYLKPEAGYRFNEILWSKISAMYAQAFLARSTPSGLGNNPRTPLGIELNAEIGYGAHDIQGELERGRLHASLLGGVLFPLAGMANPLAAADKVSGTLAWTIQARMYLPF